MRKFVFWVARQVLLIVVITLVSLTIGAVLNKEDAAKLGQIQDQMQATLRSMDPSSVWNRYLSFTTRVPAEKCSNNLSPAACLGSWSERPTFAFRGPITQWVADHISWGYLQSIGVMVAGFLDLIWATFWQPGVIPKMIGLFQLAAGTAIAAWLFGFLFGDSGAGDAPWQNPFTLPITAAMFCVAAVFFASAAAWLVYGFGTAVEAVVGAISQLGRLAATTGSYLWLTLQCVGIGLEHKIDGAVEQFFAWMAALFRKPA
jgi:hypothetical protein